jgi:hypothetical protein
MFAPYFPKNCRTGPHRRFQNLVFWACEGLVCCQDERPGKHGRGDYRVFRPHVLEGHLKALVRQQARNRGDGYHTWQKIECRENLSQLQGVQECIREARAMGDPGSPDVQAFWARHRPGSKSTISMSSTRSIYDEADLPSLLDLGQDTGRSAEPTCTAAATPTGRVLHQPPRLKPKLIVGL